MADVIQLSEHRPSGNGGREAVERYFAEFPKDTPIGDLIRADHMLLWLWGEGFMLAPHGDR